MKRCLRSFAALCLSMEVLFFSLPAFSQTRISEFKTEGGVNVVTFNVPQGIIKVYLPDDMSAGDMISGTVSVKPAGSTDAEKAKNQDVLNGYVIEGDDGNKVEANRPGFTWMHKGPLPSTPGKYVIRLIEITGQNSNPMASEIIPLTAALPAAPSSFKLP